jgi:hypothetical protein
MIITCQNLRLLVLSIEDDGQISSFISKKRLATQRYTRALLAGRRNTSSVRLITLWRLSVIGDSDNPCENAYTKIHFTSAEKGSYALPG